MQEFHSDCQDGLHQFIDPETTLFRGNLSVQFPESKRPLIIVGKEKMIAYHQFFFAAKIWKGPQGQALLLLKGEGEGIMVSVFILGELGLSPLLQSGITQESVCPQMTIAHLT